MFIKWVMEGRGEKKKNRERGYGEGEGRHRSCLLERKVKKREKGKVFLYGVVEQKKNE